MSWIRILNLLYKYQSSPALFYVFRREDIIESSRSQAVVETHVAPLNFCILFLYCLFGYRKVRVWPASKVSTRMSLAESAGLFSPQGWERYICSLLTRGAESIRQIDRWATLLTFTLFKSSFWNCLMCVNPLDTYFRSRSNSIINSYVLMDLQPFHFVLYRKHLYQRKLFNGEGRGYNMKHSLLKLHPPSWNSFKNNKRGWLLAKFKFTTFQPVVS